MSLPSKYAPQGISKELERKVTVSGNRQRKKPVNYVFRHIENKVNEAVENPKKYNRDDYQDIEMVPIEGSEEVEVIQQYITESRNLGLISQSDDMELDNFYTKTVPVHREGNVSYLIVDTNFLLSHLKTLDELKALGPRFGLRIIIPIAAIHELDGLKKDNRSHHHRDSNLSTESVSHLARWANDWVYKALADNSSTVMGQKAHQRLNKLAIKDDAILDCCLSFKKEFAHSLQVLLSNDKNLCMKALLNDVLTVSYQKNMDAKLIAEMILKENIHRFGRIEQNKTVNQEIEVKISQHPHKIQNVHETIFNEILMLVISVVKHCMESEYGDEIDLLRNYNSDKIISLRKATEVIIEFWLPVFSLHLRQMKQFTIDQYKDAKEMCETPQDRLSLEVFLEFWVTVLRALYDHEMDSTQKASLESLIKRWHEMLQSV